jgi:hypothetical protein
VKLFLLVILLFVNVEQNIIQDVVLGLEKIIPFLQHVMVLYAFGTMFLRSAKKFQSRIHHNQFKKLLQMPLPVQPLHKMLETLGAYLG